MSSRCASRSKPAKTVVALSACACLLALACGACGRRGSLEPPTGVATDRNTTAAPLSRRTLPGGIGAADAQPPSDPEAVREGDELPISATPAGTDTSTPLQTNKGAKRGFRIPTSPFFLDPIL